MHRRIHALRSLMPRADVLAYRKYGDERQNPNIVLESRTRLLLLGLPPQMVTRKDEDERKHTSHGP